jgi:molybdopterin-containing oxidoreductase family membrane subunit
MTMLIDFFLDCFKELLKGGRPYKLWLGGLASVALLGVAAYGRQVNQGLIVSGMSDQVSWGIYIANFTFLVGLAAAAVMVVIPAYIFHDKAAKSVVLLAEGVAVAACVMCLLFVLVDMGRPDRFWHLIPGIGWLNWPDSMLSWDVIVLNGYLILNVFIPMYVLFRKYQGNEPEISTYFPVIVIAIFWAISIHTVTAFLYSSNAGRPFWHTALLGPRFIASAFAAGPAVIILALQVIAAKTDFKVDKQIIRNLAIVTTVAMQINLFMLGAEIFTEFYSATAHSASAHYLFVGLAGRHALVPWIYSAITMQLIGVTILMIHPLREQPRLMNLACFFAIVGIWIEKGMGLIIPGFIPTPLGEIVEYSPTMIEVLVSLGVWSIGFLVFTALAKPAIAIEMGRLRSKHAATGPLTPGR